MQISLDDYLNLFNEAFSHYEQGHFEAAKNTFLACKQHYQNDPIIEILSRRCDKYLERGAPKNWQGIYVLEHK